MLTYRPTLILQNMKISRSLKENLITDLFQQFLMTRDSTEKKYGKARKAKKSEK